LDRFKAGLHLPPVKVGAIVGEYQFKVARHNLSAPAQKPLGNADVKICNSQPRETGRKF
jgi:hypothetical protein